MERDIDALEDNIPSAAVWIITAGKYLYENNGLDLSRVEWEGNNPNSSNRLSEGRWKTWEDQFVDLSRRSELSEEVRRWAEIAAQIMHTLAA